MQNYFTIDEISSEINVNRNTLYQKARELSIDTSKITKIKKNKLIKACESTISRKNEAKEFISDISSVKLGEIDEISSQSGSTLLKRLEIAKKEFDNVSKSLKQCQVAIDLKGTILMNGNNGTISSNPAVKTKCELLKQQNALQKTIQELEDTLKYSISTSKIESAIDD